MAVLAPSTTTTKTLGVEYTAPGVSSGGTSNSGTRGYLIISFLLDNGDRTPLFLTLQASRVWAVSLGDCEWETVGEGAVVGTVISRRLETTGQCADPSSTHAGYIAGDIIPVYIRLKNTAGAQQRVTVYINR